MNKAIHKLIVRLCAVAALLVLVIGLAPSPTFAQKPADPLADSFLNPPPSARPQVWWHWINGNISKEGITADLEAMKRVGIGGGTICNLGGGDRDAGPAHFYSDVWWDDAKFAMSEAGRLGLELGVENCEGWSSSGGPWVKPEDAMKMVVWTESRVKGGALVAIPPGQPLTRHDFYRDIAVLAFLSPANEAGPCLADISPTLTAGGKLVNSAVVISGNASNYLTIPRGTADNPGLIIDCGAPFATNSLQFSYVGRARNGSAELDYSHDGAAWTKIASCSTPSEPFHWFAHVNFAPVTARYFRIVFKDETRQPASIRLGMLNMFGPGSAAEDVVHLSDVVDISSSMKPDGSLTWTPPAGNWTIVRFGYTDIGEVNHPASKYGVGLECDKLSKTALDHHFTGFMDRVMATGATIPGAPLQWSLIDSYEVGNQNWTDDFPAVFKARTGYAITPWLISLTGRTLESPDRTSRFQFDFTRTISETWDTNYWGYFGDIMHRHGLKSQIEAYGDGIFDTVRSSGLSDMPMSEFWYPSQGDARLAKQVASAAHVYGRTLVGAESFTSCGNYFSATPWNMKREGDNIFAGGVNRYYFHSGAHQPWTDGRSPGMTWGCGIFQNRNNTWYETGKDYFAYLGRCESLLQQGHFIGDILAYEGEEGNGGQSLSMPPRGYASDQIDRDLMLESLTVANGILMLPSGQHYRILALANTNSISLPVLEKVDALVRAGAIVFGPRPVHALGLIDYPGSEQKVAKLADVLWGGVDGKTTIKNRVGKGWVYWTGDFKKVDAVLDDLHIAPDFSYDVHGGRLLYLHRRIDQADSYFITNQVTEPVTTNATFRVSGKQPEIFDPQKGTVSDATVWSADGNGNTNVALQLAPAQSLFVVFRKPVAKNHLVSASFTSLAQGASPDKILVIVKAIYGDIAGKGATLDITSKLAGLVKDNQIEVEIGNEFAGTDPAPNIVKSARIDYTIGGVPGSVSVAENDTLDLSATKAQDVKYALVQEPPAHLAIVSWTPGTLTAKDSAGKTITRQISAPPKPIEIEGAWTVHFDPRWGGPQTVMFDSLVDWTKRPEPGIKYYSGTAEYDKTIDVPDGWVKAGRAIYLDLGDLESLANVTLNGQYVGCLWSAPYRADVSGILKPGANQLQIKVTDTWVNRLIGDDGLPSNQRIASTTQQFYSPTDPLIPSGLFGPVTLVGADPVAL